MVRCLYQCVKYWCENGCQCVPTNVSDAHVGAPSHLARKLKVKIEEEKVVDYSMYCHHRLILLANRETVENIQLLSLYLGKSFEVSCVLLLLILVR